MQSPAAIPFDRVRRPPRRVSFSLRVRLCLAGLGAFACVALAISAPFCLIFDLPGLIADLARPSAPLVAVSGTVIDVERTHMQVNNSTVHRVEFSYALDGARDTGASFVTGVPALRKGATVAIDVVKGRPDTAVVRGMRRTEPPRGLVVLGLAPLASLGMLVFAVVRGVRRARLLRIGEAATGRVVTSRPTGASVNKRPVLALTLAFRTAQGRDAQVVVQTHEAGALLDSKDEPLFYDPLDPSDAVALGALPGDPRLDDAGNFTAPARALALLAWPALAALTWIGVLAIALG